MVRPIPLTEYIAWPSDAVLLQLRHGCSGLGQFFAV